MEQHATLVYFIKKNEAGDIFEICLGMKKRGLGKGKWNGFGGKVADKKAETIREAACREVLEEANLEVYPDQLRKVAELVFKFEEKSKSDQIGDVFFVEELINEPTESEEMKPEWFSIHNIPYDEMWGNDKFWLPLVLKGSFLKGEFAFLREGDSINNLTINIVDTMDESDELIERKLS